MSNTQQQCYEALTEKRTNIFFLHSRNKICKNIVDYDLCMAQSKRQKNKLKSKKK